MTDPDANPDKPVPHSRPQPPCSHCKKWPCVCQWDVPDRTYLDPEQHVPAR